MAQAFCAMPIDFDKEENSIKRSFALPSEPIKVGNDNLLRIIFAPDELTGLPRGDYAIFLSDKTTPEVRSYIQTNLLSEHVIDNIPSEKDSDILPFIREKNETREEYLSRIIEYTREDVKSRLELNQ